jgi:small subunit ribosomal protein S16
MLKIRLRRMGAIRQPSYRIVVADSRSPRDGRFVDIIGHYDPLTDPSTIRVDLARYEDWKRKGAQPTKAVESLVRQFRKRERAAEQVQAQAQARPSGRRATSAQARPAPAATAEAPVEAEAPTTEVKAPEAAPEAVEQGVTES